MKNLFYLLLCSFLAACTNQGTVIQGTLPDERYHNEMIYWVPMEGASSKTVDSARINKNAFRIDIAAHNLNKMGIVRGKPQLRISLQEIIVFTEAGVLQVQLDSVSRAGGTPLNDVLQQWKDRKRAYDKGVIALRRKFNYPDAAGIQDLKDELATLSEVYHNDIFQLISANKDNAAGKFIFSQYKTFFTPEQILEIGGEIITN